MPGTGMATPKRPEVDTPARDGDTLRITVQLIETESGYHIWSQQFDRKFEEVFAIQEEISASVVDVLKISLLGELPKVEAPKPAN